MLKFRNSKIDNCFERFDHSSGLNILMKSIREILESRKAQRKYITKEFQHYGYRLAEGLDDLKHKSLYIKLAKNEPRELLQKAWDFVKDSRAKSKAKLFMWKLKRLREGRD